MSDKPLFDVEAILKSLFSRRESSLPFSRKYSPNWTPTKNKREPMPAREEGSIGLVWQRLPLKVREQGVGVNAKQWKERLQKSRQ
ncbi:MAG: hypothetical protein OEX01_05745 [Candidatus Bathyarchaeota archaeon]|nr:hypothetical protein [Candidatus Bathyarchaeota archaeon]